MPSRKSNQFNNMIQGKLESVPKKTRKEYFDNQLRKILDINIDPYQKYLDIKNNPNLAPQDLQKIIDRLPSPSIFPEIREKWDEVVNHRDRIAAKIYYQKYLDIKNDPNLTPQDLQKIIEKLPMPSTFPEIREKWDEVVNHRDRIEKSSKTLI